jgi:hypothetical protein
VLLLVGSGLPFCHWLGRSFTGFVRGFLVRIRLARSFLGKRLWAVSAAAAAAALVVALPVHGWTVGASIRAARAAVRARSARAAIS